MKEVSIFDAKTYLSGLINQVYTQHESIIITKRGIKIAKIIPYETKEARDISDLTRELQALSDEVGRVGITTEDIQQMKKEGQK